MHELKIQVWSSEVHPHNSPDLSMSICELWRSLQMPELGLKISIALEKCGSSIFTKEPRIYTHSGYGTTLVWCRDGSRYVEGAPYALLTFPGGPTCFINTPAALCALLTPLGGPHVLY